MTCVQAKHLLRQFLFLDITSDWLPALMPALEKPAAESLP